MPIGLPACVAAYEQILVAEGLLSEIQMSMPTVVIATPGKLPLGKLINRLRANHRDLAEVIAARRRYDVHRQNVVTARQWLHADDRGLWPWERGYRGVHGGQPVLGRRASVATL